MSPQILAYGEDSLTLKYVRERLAEILDKLEDDTHPEDCTVFYRPSFGRSGLYGEFDAIIVATKIAYLVESKWRMLTTKTRSQLKLNKTQIIRHKILTWFHNNWNGGDWDIFVSQNESQFQTLFPGKHIPKSKTGGETTILAENLQTVLNIIRGKRLQNVLLYFHRGEIPKFNTNFQIVTIEYTPTCGNFIQIL